MEGILSLMLAPFAICVILTGIHCYLGIHVVTRGIIFVDLALAQIAALGTTVALLAGHELNSTTAYIYSMARLREEKIPQEAFIGVVYAISSAAAILILDRAPHGHEAIHAMLVGSVLYVTWPLVLKTFLIYISIGAVHFIFRKQFMLISTNIQEAQKKKMWISCSILHSE